MPQNLSQLGCFEGDDPRWPSPALIAFAVNAPRWTDGAEKERFMAVPAGQRIALDARGDFVFPQGTVLVKTFAVGGARVETRVLMHHAEGWHGVSYHWNEAGTDAELAPAEGMSIAAVGPSAQPWTIPGRGECFSCHNAATHVALGLEVAQLQRDFVDPRTGEGGNQLDRLIARGLLDADHPLLAAPAGRPKLADYHDAEQPIAARARAYLHANCSSCHAGTEGICSGDLRWTAEGAQMGVCDVAPTLPGASLGWPEDTRLLAPGDPERSAIVHLMRASAGAPLLMPPIGRSAVDAGGVALVSDWIRQLRGCSP
jgi:uncharacterized repeat protein (TIGR03806 family)